MPGHCRWGSCHDLRRAAIVPLLLAILRIRDQELATITPGWLDVEDRDAYFALQTKADSGAR